MAGILLKIGGCYNLAFAAFHLFFWRIFDWKRDLASLSFLNRAIMQVLNLCLTFVFVAFGYLSLAHGGEMLGSPLGRALIFLIGLFWLLRALQQAIFFRLRKPLSWAFLFVFLAGAGVYLALSDGDAA